MGFSSLAMTFLKVAQAAEAERVLWGEGGQTPCHLVTDMLFRGGCHSLLAKSKQLDGPTLHRLHRGWKTWSRGPWSTLSPPCRRSVLTG